MPDNGVSKKLCITAAGIIAVTQLADGAENKWPYAIVVCIMCVVFKIVQGWIDSRKG
ncbi:hypothetical protein LCGC14_2889460 [marine sediment metagenome]|uniref:Uncharacterized protein n=1 Tax=marine sediment metagenome TaxID=412755 RepID=A0A0F8XXR7_9ZZZZ